MTKTYHADCFDTLKNIEPNSIDAIIADLPYGTTNCKWDSILPLNDYIPTKKRNRVVFLSKNDFMLLQFQIGGGTKRH